MAKKCPYYLGFWVWGKPRFNAVLVSEELVHK